MGSHDLELPEHLTLPASEAATTLTLEIAYSFLPTAWRKGYATESAQAMFDACERGRSFWEPFSKLYIRAIVNDGNPASMRVMQKIGMTKRGVFVIENRPVFLAGQIRDHHELHIYGRRLLE